ncbi:3-dehydroquinate synthase [Lacrimispora saccharolytica]|nr:3-dehydroquinate synthase [Lacrimispora saccharolytica]
MKSLLVKQEKQGEAFSYEILWKEDFFSLGAEVKKLQLPAKKACIVADSTVAELYLEQVKQELEPLFEKVTVFIFPAGEEHKNLQTVQKLYTHLIEEKLERKDLLFALGGGVTGDLTGYAAATYLRGIDFIQIPTTLLAQVDSSIGGKTGVDFDQYKNMVGAFHHPRLVYMNTSVLKTLSGEQFACGMGEVLKTGLIRDEKFYIWTINHMEPIMERVPAVLTKMIQKCCDIKRIVVENDPKEQGERAVLNLGHTVGHAIEKLKDFQLAHGQCVALGTVAAAYISFKRGYLSTEEFYEIRDMNVGFDLPITFTGLNPEDILAATKSDKKMENGTVKFILLKSLGHAVVDHTVTDEELLEAINFINGDRIDEE